MIAAGGTPKTSVIIDLGTRGDRVVVSLTAKEATIEARLSVEEAINMRKHLDQIIETATRMEKLLRGTP